LNKVSKILVALLLSLSSLSYAAEITKIGILNVQELVGKAVQAEEAGKRLEKEFQARKDGLFKKQEEAQKKHDKLQRDKDVLSDSEKNKLEKEITKARQDLRHQEEELRNDFMSRQQEEQEAFFKVVKEVVNQIAKDEQYDLILSSELAVFVADKVDVTTIVLAKLNSAKASDSKKK